MLRNWKYCAKSPRDEAVAQLFELLLSNAKKELAEEKERYKDHMDTSEDKERHRSSSAQTDPSSQMPRVTFNSSIRKENINPEDGDRKNPQANTKYKPLARTRQPSGTPLRHTIQKMYDNMGELSKQVGYQGASSQEESVKLTEE